MKKTCISAGASAVILLIASLLFLGQYYGGAAVGLVSLAGGLIFFYLSAGLLRNRRRLRTPQVLLPLFIGIACSSLLLILFFAGGRNYGLAAMSAIGIFPVLLLAAGLAARFLTENK